MLQLKVTQHTDLCTWTSTQFEHLQFCMSVSNFVLAVWNQSSAQNLGISDWTRVFVYSLKYLDVPCLNVGTPRKPIYLPAEVCTIAPGQRRLKLDEKQTAAMIKSAAQRPEERAWNIGCSVNEKGCLPQDPHVRAFGMDIQKSMMKVKNSSHLQRMKFKAQNGAQHNRMKTSQFFFFLFRSVTQIWFLESAAMSRGGQIWSLLNAKPMLWKLPPPKLP